MSNLVKVGDKVMWRGSFGMGPQKPATITGLELCEERRTKYGVSVPAALWDYKEYLLVSLDNGHWAYGEQIFPYTHSL